MASRIAFLVRPVDHFSSISAIFELVGVAIVFILFAVGLFRRRNISGCSPYATAISLYWFISGTGHAIALRTLATANVGGPGPVFPLLLVMDVICLVGEQLKQCETMPGLSPEERAGPLGSLLFSWIVPLFSTGHRRPLTEADLGSVSHSLSGTATYPRFKAAWDKEKKRAAPSLGRALLVGYASDTVAPVILTIANTAFVYAQPLLLQILLEEFASPQAPSFRSTGFAVAGAMLFVATLGTLCSVWAEQQVRLIGFKARSGISGAIFRKSMQLNATSRAEFGVGEIMNRLTSDAEGALSLHHWLIMLIGAGLQVIVAMLILYMQLSWPAFIGFALLLLSGPLQGHLAKNIRQWFLAKRKAMDVRLRLTNEILAGLLSIKMLGLETNFLSKLEALRVKELVPLRSLARASFSLVLLSSGLPVVAFVLMIGTHAAVSSLPPLTSSTVFVSLTTFQLLRAPLGNVSQALSFFMAGLSSMERIGDLLVMQDREDGDVDSYAQWGGGDDGSIHSEHTFEMQEPATSGQIAPSERKSAGSIQIAHGNFGWLTTSERMVLNDINMNLSAGSLTAIVGRTGQGKSALLAAIIGQMDASSGKVEAIGTFALASQAPWLQNATVRDNILFGSAYDEDRFARVVDACSLTKDLVDLDGGDQALVATRGGNLSGGQKQRLCLARAAYCASADIYLFDDPLSALDAHVAQEVFDKLFGNAGLLSGKTRVLVTNALHIVPRCDRVFLIEAGMASEIPIAETGSLRERMAALESAATKLAQEQSLASEHGQHESEGSETSGGKVMSFKKTPPDDDNEISAPSGGKVMYLQKGPSPGDKKKSKPRSGAPPGQIRIDSPSDKEERIKPESLGWSVYWRYLVFANLYRVAAYVGTSLLATGTVLAARFWLEHWFTDSGNAQQNSTALPHSLGYYLGIYVALTLAGALMTTVPAYTWMGVCAIKASDQVHKELANSVLRQPMSWLDTTPQGRIANRFTDDVHMTDMALPPIYMSTFNLFVGLVASLIPSIVNTPVILVVMIPVALLFSMYGRFYLASQRVLKRLGAALRSPVCNNLSETLDGISTIHAFKREAVAIDNNRKMIDAEQAATYLSLIGSQWFTMCIQSVGSVVVFAITALSVHFAGSLNAARVGLALSYATGATQDIAELISYFAMLSLQMVYFERLVEYIDLPPEDVAKGQDAPEDWPRLGAVEFRNVNMRYRSGLDLALRNVSFDIPGGSKVAIVGRTGAGKSSLAIALLRLAELCKPGTEDEKCSEASHGPEINNVGIFIDSVNISSLSLASLRSKMTVIPQVPVLFAGTLRSNLDPKGEHDDEALWRALKIVGLAVDTSAGSALDAPVSVNGDNFSAGERQLICIARAIIHNARIVVMDEPSSSVDPATYAKVTLAVDVAFASCTVLTICHRTEGLIAMDRILCMKDGSVVEDGAPSDLQKDPMSLFSQLYASTG
ncbi:Canalicular multispecific organic anion transporter 2 [Thoreauomyces humboldtii]|nr:Canalicular multispecific organic anion transporter 2 [Thoreauomyces humboldtii]